MTAVSNELALNSADNLATTGTALQSAINTLKAGQSNIMSTFKVDSQAGKIAVFNAMTNAESLADNLGTVINLRNVVIQPVEMPVDEKDEAKGTAPVPRIVLVDEDGTAYAALSNGIFKSLENIFAIFGYPTEWTEPVSVIAEEKRSRNGFRFMTLSTAPEPVEAKSAK